MTEPSSERLLAEQLTRYRPIMLTLADALISQQLRGDLEASDLVQQTLLEAHREAERLAGFGQRQLFAWLRQALRHNVLDAVKHVYAEKHDVRRRLRIGDLDNSFVRLEQLFAGEQATPSEILARNEQIAELMAAIQELPVNQRQAVVMKHLRGQSLREISAALQVSPAAAAGLLHRGRQKLLHLLEPATDG